MPTVPGGVAPPIATLPPTGVVPSVPGVVVPPTVTPPSSATSESIAGQRLALATPTVKCRDATTDQSAAASGNVQLVDCTDPQQRAAVEAQGATTSGVPITRGREFAPVTLWNAWADSRFDDTRDRRNGLESDGGGGYLTLGIDRLFKTHFVGGFSLGLERNHTDGFGGEFRLESSGFSVGPYIGMQLSPRWALDASVSFGWIDNDSRIAVLSGSNTTERTSAAVDLTTQYDWGDTALRPKFSLYYTHSRDGAYHLSGTVGGIPVALPVEKNSSNSTVASVSAEIHHIARLSGGKLVVPYSELGVLYNFNDTQLLTGNLTFADASPWSGYMRIGAKALFSQRTWLEAAVSYQSLGTNDLDTWEGKLYLSHSF